MIDIKSSMGNTSSNLKNLFNIKKDHYSNSPKRSFSSFTSKKKGSVKSYNQNASNNGSNSVIHSSSITSSSGSNSKQYTSSSGHNHEFRDGRRYHGDESVAYVLPNDDDGMLLLHTWMMI